ncbi:fatty acid desaturase [Gramella sp. BOM4]|nr:fatty acid desaturase [Christiangramia bathymodioli]
MQKTTASKPKYVVIGDRKFLELRNSVLDKVSELERSRKWQIKFKAICFPLLYVATYCLLLKYGNKLLALYLFYSLLGLVLVFNFLNLIHDAVHGILFRKKWLNQLYIYFFDLLGANSYIWKVRHIRLHHAYPNVMNWDSDLEQSPLVRIFPQSAHKDIHRFQHIYLPFIYPLYLFNWLLIRDFKDYFKKDSIARRIIKIPFNEYVKLFLFKAFFLGYLVVIPALFLNHSWFVILSGFFTMVITASIFSLLVLLSPHANIESEFMVPDEHMNLKYPWFEHQLKCTNDVSTENFFTRFFMANFNYHIAHHLFPNIHHIYYPEVTRLIKEFSSRHDLQYKSHDLFTCLAGHFRLLKHNSIKENIFEETM